MSEAMSAEFDTVAVWTAQVANDLGPSYHIPAACRGSGSPVALDWLIEQLDLAPGETFLDCGAGVGGPAAYAAQQRSVQPVLVEPEAGACRAARSLFGYPVVQAVASALPVADESFNAAWSLGVLCTMQTQLALLTELRRVVRPQGRIGLLVFVARTSTPAQRPQGNNFPTVDALVDLVAEARLRIAAWRGLSDLPSASSQWQSREDAVTAELSNRHGHKRAWQLAEHQSDLIGGLLARSDISGELLTLIRR
jgi:ubiquinone/menaquinone biosynthesis C-methylase UbiE